MNDFTDSTQTPDNQPDPSNPHRPLAFCQNCGKSLDSETVRKVGTAVFCEPCLAARIGAAPPNPAAGYGPVNAAGPAYAGMPIVPSPPNPGLAALLGLIPGVGAMYNEQYAKGILHLLIFAVLVSFSHVTGIFILFVFGWVAYMSIEAHHTARARRDGTPLPNPFGFNDIAERMGFGSAWPTGPDVAGAARDAANYAASGFHRAASTPPPAPGPYAPPVPAPAAQDPAWGAPVETYASAPAYTQPYAQPYTYVPPATPYAAPYATPYTPIPDPPPDFTPRNRFPTGAVWLIGLGSFFLLSTLGVFHAIPGSSLIGVILLGLGAWTFLRRMTETGLALAPDGSSSYQLRILRALRGSIWLIAIGIFSLLISFNLASVETGWPWLIILAGVMMILERTVFNSVAANAHTAPPAPPDPTQPNSNQGGI